VPANGRSTEENAHDVLAAEAFAVPAADPELHHRPVWLPEDPAGISEPHDVLAAEEFPMPAVGHPATRSLASRTEGWRPAAILGAAVATLLLLRSLTRRH
jgi:hypothetical protein